MMVVARAAGLSDAGRRRRQNEDAFVCDPPLFAIADGMGGAQAGELASRLAAASVGSSDAGGLAGRDRVIALIEGANRDVYERAARDESVSGMGTTMTIAFVEDGVVWFGHVGDSRAYLVRAGALEQVTDDHSLVAELVRSGRLTEEEAESHPHRSVITRALGTEPDVEVDAIAVEPRPGDIFLLCSDGLTTMVDDDTILELVEGNRERLDDAVRALVDAANSAGGEDNITVVLFEVGAGDGAEGEAPVAPAGRGTDEDTLHGIEIPAHEPAGTLARSSRRLRLGPVLAATAIAVIALGAIGVFGLSRAHFVGAEPDGHVAVYQGLPWDLGFGIRLYHKVYESRLLTANLSEGERRTLFDHDLESRDAAMAAIRQYEQDVVP
jgi:serine/threonine protein phosphatase PrpC